MSTLTMPPLAAAPGPSAPRADGFITRFITRPFDELQRREPLLANLALIFAIAIVACLVAMQVDTRTVNGISVWIKPAKFFSSLAVYFATLAWFFGALPAQARHTRAGRYMIRAAAIAGTLEMTWLVAAAVAGVPSHFNRTSLVWGIAYSLGGAGALVLLSAMVVQAWMVARGALPSVAPAMREAIVLGSIAAAVTTLVTAGYLSAQPAHWVGGIATDANGLPIVGWSRSGGDLRVAHFVATHLQQAIPLVAWLALRVAPRAATPIVRAAIVAGVVVVAAVFVQALRGMALIG